MASCNSCSDSGLFPGKSNKNIKFSSNGIGGCKLVVTEGSNVVASLDTCKWQSSYEQYFTSNMYLPAGKKDMPIEYGAVGTQITFIAIMVEYIATQKSPLGTPPSETPCLTYEFETNPDIDRPINKIFIHSGTSDKRIPKIFLTNPTSTWDARVHILASTEELTFDEVETVSVGDDVLTITNLEYIFLKSTSQGLCVLDAINGDTQVFIVWENISNIELNGKYITIDDTAMGKINLEFKSEFDTKQTYSLILWAMTDPDANLIPSPASADTTPPVITYNTSFTTEILLEDYPANGSNGSNGYLITKDDLITLQINNVTDNRDGLLILDGSNISLSKVDDTTEIDNIMEIGKYNFIITVSDNAQNVTTESFILNIKDELPPQIVITTLAKSMITDNGTSGTNFNQTNSVYLEDYFSDTIEQQDLIDLFIDTIFDARDGEIIKHINNVNTSINLVGSNVLLNKISSIGNYEVRFAVDDSDSNTGTEFYDIIDTPLGVDVIRVVISENQPPEIFFNTDYSPLFLNAYPSQTITKAILNSDVVDQVTDDRDGIITTDVLNIQVFQTGIPSSTSGTNSIFVAHSTAGTAGEFFDPISDVELISIVDKGLYKVRVNVTDSDGAFSTEDDDFTVFD